MMDKVQKPSDSECYTPSLESFRFSSTPAVFLFKNILLQEQNIILKESVQKIYFKIILNSGFSYSKDL
jgi:hypothetical protein